MVENSREKVVERVSSLVRNVLKLESDIKIDCDRDLFEHKSIDSVLLIDLLNQIEREFSVHVTPDVFIPENFSTVNKIAEVVIELLNVEKK